MGSTVSWNTGVAIRTGNGNVCIYPDRIFVDGKNIGTSFSSYNLSGGGLIKKEGSQLMVSNLKGDVIKVNLFQGSLDYYFSPSISRKGKLMGLLGNYDGNASNDIQVQGGQLIQPSYVNLYPNYTDSWRIKETESLFVYDLGKSTESYTDRNFPRAPVNLTTTQRANAKTICEKAGIIDPVLLENCIIDIGSTSDEALATRIFDHQIVITALESFSIGNFNSSDVKLDYFGASADSKEAILDTKEKGFSRILMKQGVNIKNGFESEFSFSSSELSASSVFYLALWPTDPKYRSNNQNRAGFGFRVNDKKGIVFFIISSDGVVQEKEVPNFVDGQIHKVKIIENRQSDNSWKLQLFLDNMESSELAMSNNETICERINAKDDIGFIEFQITKESPSDPPSSVKLYNWSFNSF